MKCIFCYLILTICSASLAAQQRELSSSEIIKLIPDQVKGYRQDDEPKSKQMQIGTITYSLTEKKFTAGRQSIKILLFDFTNAPIMYAQALRGWKQAFEIDSDSLIYRYISMENCRGWETYDKSRSASQIFLGISDRFFLSMTGENTSLDQLQLVVKAMQIEGFPKSR